MLIKNHQLRLRVTSTLCFSAAALIWAMNSGADSPTSPRLTASAKNVSGVSPWLGLDCNDGSTSLWARNQRFMGEPTVAVNPHNPRQQIIGWQDRYRASIDTAYTKDDGLTWYRSPAMGTDSCTGNIAEAWQGTVDIWVSFGPDGQAYLSTLPFAGYYPFPENSEYKEFTRVSRSSDGGKTWSAPVTVPNPLMADDKDMVLADILNPGTVYTASRNTAAGAAIGARGVGQVLFGRSDDGGKTFTLTVLEDSGSPALSYGSPLLAELNNGTLVYTYGLPSGPEVARLSTDGGLSWSAPITVAPAPTSGDIQACGTPVALRADGAQDAVLDGTSVLRVFVNRSADGTYSLMLSRSTDGATSWEVSTLVTSRLPIGLPSIATDSWGRIAVLYDVIDSANISCNNPVIIPARTLVAVSSDQGRTWGSVTLGAEWWNFAAGGVDPGFGEYWVADYQSIVANRHGFTAATPQGPTLSGSPPQGGITGFMSIIAGDVRVGDYEDQQQ